MQLKSFNSFVSAVISEGLRLQRYDINGQKKASGRFTQMQIIAKLVAIGFIFLVPEGFTTDFAGFVISFLGIFIGLFTSIIISLFDKRGTYLQDYDKVGEEGKVRMKKIKNYLIQFTGLTAYSIFLALIVVFLLTIKLLNNHNPINPFDYRFVSINTFDKETIINFTKILITIVYRWLVVYFLINILFLTIYSITSYFSFLSSEYKNIKLKDD